MALKRRKQIGNLEDFPACKDVLPEGYDYEICSYKDEPLKLDDEKQFSAIVRTRALTKEEVHSWLEKFALRSGSIFRVDRTHRPGSRTVFKVQYRCHHNTRPRKNSKPHAKHTDCHAKLTITIKNVKRPHLSKDGYLPEFPTVIMLRHTHNHHLFRSESLRFTDPSSSVRERLLSLFESGHSVASALAVHTSDVLEAHDVSHHQRLTTDRRLIPSCRWVRYLYDKVFLKPNQTGHHVVDCLKKCAQRYNAKCGEECVRVEHDDDGHFSLAVCSPLMKRVHELSTCGEFLLVDSSSNNRFLCRVYVLQVHTAVGGLPLGVLITSSGLKRGLSRALDLYTQLLPSQRFGGQTSGPSLVILGPSTADETAAFSALFPHSTLVHSVYHSLHGAWNFLTTSEHGVPSQLMPHAYLLIRRLLRSSNLNELNVNYNAVKSHPITNNYPKFEHHLSELFEQVGSWAQLRQGEEYVCAIVEASIEAFRDRILTRTKAVNPAQLLEFIVESPMEKFYVCKMECALLGQENEWFSNEFKEVSTPPMEQQLRVSEVDVENSVFEVSSEASGDRYVVDVMLGLCTCFVGRTGAKCAHQLAVKRDRDLPKLNFQVLEEDDEARRFYQRLLTDCCGRGPGEGFLVLPEDGANVEVSHLDHHHAYLVASEDSAAGQVEAVRGQLKQVFDDLMLRLQSSPQHFLSPLQAFVDGYQSLKSDVDRVEALNNFAATPSPSSPDVLLLPYDLMASINQR